MAAKRTIFVLSHFDFGKNLKNHFPKGIFQWNLAHNGSSWIHKHCWNKNRWDLRGKTSFPALPNGNLCWLARKRRARSDFFFFRQTKRIHEGDNYKQHRSKTFNAIVVKYAKHCGRAPRDLPPPRHLSVNVSFLKKVLVYRINQFHRTQQRKVSCLIVSLSCKLEHHNDHGRLPFWKYGNSFSFQILVYYFGLVTCHANGKLKLKFDRIGSLVISTNSDLTIVWYSSLSWDHF